MELPIGFYKRLIELVQDAPDHQGIMNFKSPQFKFSIQVGPTDMIASKYLLDLHQNLGGNLAHMHEVASALLFHTRLWNEFGAAAQNPRPGGLILPPTGLILPGGPNGA